MKYINILYEKIIGILMLKGVGRRLHVMFKSLMKRLDFGAHSSSTFTNKLLATMIINTEFKIFKII
jgi:hypothetical protein